MTQKLEAMDEFFTKRLDGYDEHMINEVDGCANGYKKLAQLIAKKAPSTLLDLGCGTGLELDEIFPLLPDIKVTGIDLTKSMLDRLKEKHPDKNMSLIVGDYFAVDLPDVDAAISFQTMHHFTHEKKISLYSKIYAALSDDGIYIEGDYMCDTDEQEAEFFAEYERLKREQKLGGGYFHYDTPCTIKNQISMLHKAGFSSVTQVFRDGNTVILVAEK